MSRLTGEAMGRCMVSAEDWPSGKVHGAREKMTVGEGRGEEGQSSKSAPETSWPPGLAAHAEGGHHRLLQVYVALVNYNAIRIDAVGAS